MPGVPGNFRYRNSPALSGISHSPKISGKLPGPVPVHVPDNCQTACDDRLKAGPLRETGQPPGFSGDGWGRPSLMGGTWGTLTQFSGKSYEKTVQKKDPGNDPQCAPCAPVNVSGTGSNPISIVHSPKISGTRTSRYPFMFRAIAKRHAISGPGCLSRSESRFLPSSSQLKERHSTLTCL